MHAWAYLQDGDEVVMLALRPLLQALAPFDYDAGGALVATGGACVVRLVAHEALDGRHHAAQRRHLVQLHL